MGVIYNTIKISDLFRYEPEYNEDGTEKHIRCDGARYHVLWWDGRGKHCSAKNCEINKKYEKNINQT